MLAIVLSRFNRAFVYLAATVCHALRRGPRRPRRSSIRSLLVVFALWGACTGAHAQALDVFGQPLNATATAAPAQSGAATPPSWRYRNMPNWVRAGIGVWLRVQAGWNARIEGFLAQWSHGASLAAWATLIVVSFGYGALHALGPGHGKFVASTYLASRRARVTDAILLSSWTATVQALSAIGLVLGAAWFAHAGLMSVMPRAAYTETVSYLLLCITSVWAIISARARTQCCDGPPVVRFPRGNDTSTRRPTPTAVDEMGHDQSVPGAYLRTHMKSVSAAGARNVPTPFRTPVDARPMPRGPARSRLRQIGMLGLAVGMRPCIGAIFALVASMAIRELAAGVVATFAMAAGVATTVALIGLGSIGANRMLARLALRFRMRSARAARVVAIGAIGMILLISALQLALLLSGVTAASFT
jgi:nickel/cobalt transporter (NicO) family protein